MVHNDELVWLLTQRAYFQEKIVKKKEMGDDEARKGWTHTHTQRERERCAEKPARPRDEQM